MVSEKQTKLDKYIAVLKALNETILGEALIEKAYRIDVVTKILVIEFSQKFDIELQFGKKFGGFHTCQYAGWQLRMESE